MTTPSATWVLVSDARGARIFSFLEKSGQWTLHDTVNGDFESLVLGAPPKLLGELRENLGRGLQAAIVSDVHEDYSHSGVAELIDRPRPKLPA